MNLEALVLGLFSGLRPGTSLAAVLVLLERPTSQRLLLLFTAAGFASSWAIGLVVVGVFHGANVAVGGSTFTAVLDVAFGAAALGFAAGLQRGWVQPRRRRSSSPSATAASSRFARNLQNPSARNVVALWFLIPLASLVLAMVRPGAARAYLDAATAWIRRHEHAVLVSGSFIIGGYLVIKGTTRLLT